MATTISTQDLIDVKRDIEDIGKAVNEKVIVSPRYGDPFRSLPMISAEFQISSDAAASAAVSAAESANFAQSSANIAEAAATAATIGAGVFETPEAGVDPVKGVADGAYYNVRSSSDESYVDEYQNVGGVPTPSGKSYPSAAYVQNVAKYTALPFVGGKIYRLNERVQLENGDIVKSTIDGNTNNPNVDMDGWRQPNDLTGSPIMFGAKGDGVFDDTLAIQECANKFRYLDMRNGRWKTTGKITLREGTVVDLRGAYLSANNANEPIFEFQNAGDGLSILGGGGYVYGTADSFLRCSGKTYQPTAQTDYARQIRLDGVYVSGENIDKFLDFDKAVRQVFMTKVFAYVKNGMFCNGKCVEFEIYGSIIYGAKGATDLNTYGIKYVSPGGGRWYNEGLHITDSTIDNFGTTFDIRDIYAMSITGGHIGSAMGGDGIIPAGSKTAIFGQPTSTACRDIKFNGVNIYGYIEFAPVGGIEYQAKFTGCSSEMCNGANIFIKNNAASITVSNHTFHSSTNGVAVVCQSNNLNISVNDITCDQTFVGGVHVRGAIGDNVSVRNINYAGSGYAVYCERPILISGVPVATADMANYKRKLVSAPQATYAVSQTIATVSAGFAKGETGEIVVELSYSGATPTTQSLKINTPDGLIIPSGSGWSSEFVVLKSASGTISARIPYFVTQNISVDDISLTNFEGSALTLGYHGYFGVQRDW